MVIDCCTSRDLFYKGKQGLRLGPWFIFTFFGGRGGVGLRLYVPVKNVSVVPGRSHRFLGITSTFLGGKCNLLKDTTRQPE